MSGMGTPLPADWPHETVGAGQWPPVGVVTPPEAVNDCG